MNFKEFANEFERLCHEADDSLNFETSIYYSNKADKLTEQYPELLVEYLNT